MKKKICVLLIIAVVLIIGIFAIRRPKTGGGSGDTAESAVDILGDGISVSGNEVQEPGSGETTAPPETGAGESGAVSGQTEQAGGTSGVTVQDIIDEAVSATESQYSSQYGVDMDAFADIISEDTLEKIRLSEEAMEYDRELVGTGKILGGRVRYDLCPDGDAWVGRYDETIGFLEKTIVMEFPEKGMPEYIEVFPYGNDHLVECLYNTGAYLYYIMYHHDKSDTYQFRLTEVDRAEVDAMRWDLQAKMLESVEMDGDFFGVTDAWEDYR